MSRNPSLLIIDDETDLADNYASLFRLKGWFATAAYSGDEGVSRLRHTDFDVVLLDMRMPEKDGFQTLLEILQERPQQCIIFLTAYADSEAAVKALQMGATSMITKGQTFPVLSAEVVREYEKKSERDAIVVARDEALARAAREDAILSLAQGMSHQIKNKVVTIGGRLSLIESAETMEQVRKEIPYLRKSLDSTLHVVSILHRIAETRNMDSEVLSIDEVSEMVRSRFFQSNSRKQYKEMIGFTCENSFLGSVSVLTNREGFGEAMECIFDNSIDALRDVPKRSITTSIGVREDLLVIRTEDSGEGFSSEALAHADEPGFSTKGTPRTHFGFGLAFVKAVAEHFRGQFTFGNLSQDRGAWTEFRLPISQEKEEDR